MPADATFHELPLETRLALRLRGDRAVFLTGDDNLQLSSWNSLTGVGVTIAGRVLGLDGHSRPFVHTATPNTDRTIASIVRKLGEGWLTEFTVFVSAAAPILGQTFVRVQIVRGLEAATQVLATLGAGYITAVQPLAWPGCAVARSIEGPGALRSITGTNPAAGVDIAETVPTGAVWRLLSFFARFVADATVMSRQPVLSFDDGTSDYFRTDTPQNQTASQTNDWVAAPGMERLTLFVNSRSWGTPTDVRFRGGHRILITTGSIQAGDNWGAPQLWVEEWLEGAA